MNAAPVLVASPCIDLCRMDARSGLCEGCRRTIDEIAAWSKMSNDERRAVLLLIDQRPAPVIAPTSP